MRAVLAPEDGVTKRIVDLGERFLKMIGHRRLKQGKDVVLASGMVPYQEQGNQP